MNLAQPLRLASRVFRSACSLLRRCLPRHGCRSFISLSGTGCSGLREIYVINLDREPRRWVDVSNELNCFVDSNGTPLCTRAIRCSATDAQSADFQFSESEDVIPFYSLADQLFVEPQPQAMPDSFSLTDQIAMSRAEVAVARSHIDIWRTIANGNSQFALVLEDDVQFERKFGHLLDAAWEEMKQADGGTPKFDVLYVSYREVRHGAPKQLISSSLFRPERGLWFLSGYILSKKGAKRLLSLLPCRGPIDLWINHQFRHMDVRALRRSVINQRHDLDSTNNYSVLPALTKIGILDYGNASLFQRLPTCSPVFVFGDHASTLSSIAMALSMLGYRCCSDFEDVPAGELQNLIKGRRRRIFNAYVNIRSLVDLFPLLAKGYPNAKFIMACDDGTLPEGIGKLPVGCDVIFLGRTLEPKWNKLCEHLKLAPPDASFPTLDGSGLRPHERIDGKDHFPQTKWLKHDTSPWIAPMLTTWNGIHSKRAHSVQPNSIFVRGEDNLTSICLERWIVRSDTFPGNLGLFRSTNVSLENSGGVSLSVAEEPLGVRQLSAGAMSSRNTFLYGRFEATIKSTNVPGLVTGFFLHRNSPRQEIDIEIRGNRPDQLLANVFYNPGSEGAQFDYGFRGAPAAINLGFDASQQLHHYAIEWDPNEIRWFVDSRLVHRRVIWAPTPIPHLPMTLHLNHWPTSSRELAGRLNTVALPASAFFSRIAIDAYTADATLYGW